jgi:hypothetical protein
VGGARKKGTRRRPGAKAKVEERRKVQRALRQRKQQSMAAAFLSFPRALPPFLLAKRRTLSSSYLTLEPRPISTTALMTCGHGGPSWNCFFCFFFSREGEDFPVEKVELDGSFFSSLFFFSLLVHQPHSFSLTSAWMGRSCHGWAAGLRLAWAMAKGGGEGGEEKKGKSFREVREREREEFFSSSSSLLSLRRRERSDHKKRVWKKWGSERK